MTVLQGFTAGMFEGWTRLPLSDRCRVVIVALTVPCAVALALAVRPPQRPPGQLFLGLETLEATATEPWAVQDEFKDGRRTEAAPAVHRAEVIVESDRVLPEGVVPSAKAAWVSRVTRDAASPHVRNSRAVRPESQR